MSFEYQKFQEFFSFAGKPGNIVRAKSREELGGSQAFVKKKFKKFRIFREILTEKIRSPSSSAFVSGNRRGNALVFIEKSIKSPELALKRYQNLSKEIIRSRSNKRVSSVKSLRCAGGSPKTLQFKPSKGKYSFGVKPFSLNFEFSFELEEGIMKSACIVCRD
jgi:hypothetical protein